MGGGDGPQANFWAGIAPVSLVNQTQMSGLQPALVYFLSSLVKFVTTVIGWLTCCETRSIKSF
jgi:hypothetical protein